MATQLIKANGIDLWCETFGKKVNSPVLLIQGSGAQGILWPETFCEKLATSEYYVVRYDHRDTGQSSYVDYRKYPYDLKDLMEDVTGILDAFDFAKVHIIGASMGGYIAQLLGVYHPERVLTVTLMMSSVLSFSLEHAFLEGKSPFSLPLPTKQFTNALLEIGPVPQTLDGLSGYMLSVWAAYNGEGTPFERSSWSSLAGTWVTGTKNLSASYNHRLAVGASSPNREQELQNLYQPTLIIHGAVDPFFSIEHAYALQKAIPSSTLHIVEKMGHLFHDAFIEEVLETLLPHLEKR